MSVVLEPRARVKRHETDIARWELASAVPDPFLAAHVRRYCGYSEHAAGPMRRRELPSGEITLIVSMGPSIRVGYPAQSAPDRYTSFVAGLHDSYAVTEYEGSQHGVELDLTPLGAWMLLGVPMSELAGRVVGLDDLMGEAASELAERLHDAPGWDDRFHLLDAVLAERLAEAPAPSPRVEWVWRRLVDSNGSVPVGALAAELGWSRRHLATQFREHVGTTPKLFARILRFRRAVGLLERDDGTRFAEIAYACGYYDQAHLNRDFRELAGGTPTDFLARRLPAGGGIRAD